MKIIQPWSIEELKRSIGLEMEPFHKKLSIEVLIISINASNSVLTMIRSIFRFDILNLIK